MFGNACLAMPDPDPDDMFAFVYREPHPLVEEERAWFADYDASFADPGGAQASTLGGAR